MERSAEERTKYPDRINLDRRGLHGIPLLADEPGLRLLRLRIQRQRQGQIKRQRQRQRPTRAPWDPLLTDVPALGLLWSPAP